ncbi:hypothetical protein YC2023_076233 [Brassica napus]
MALLTFSNSYGQRSCSSVASELRHSDGLELASTLTPQFPCGLNRPGPVKGIRSSPTRRTGELDDAFGPTHPFGELDVAFGPTRSFSELD